MFGVYELTTTCKLDHDKRLKQRGFTLIEVLSVTWATSLLMAVLGVILSGGYMTWHAYKKRVAFQQDITVALTLLERAARGAASNEIAVEPERLTYV